MLTGFLLISTQHNILISSHNSPLLADFGLSLVLTQSQATTTASSVTRGTIRWMAKELLLPTGDESLKYNEQTDIWAFGMVAYVRLVKNLIIWLLTQTMRHTYCRSYSARTCLTAISGVIPRSLRQSLEESFRRCPL